METSFDNYSKSSFYPRDKPRPDEYGDAYRRTRFTITDDGRFVPLKGVDAVFHSKDRQQIFKRSVSVKKEDGTTQKKKIGPRFRIDRGSDVYNFYLQYRKKNIDSSGNLTKEALDKRDWKGIRNLQQDVSEIYIRSGSIDACVLENVNSDGNLENGDSFPSYCEAFLRIVEDMMNGLPVAVDNLEVSVPSGGMVPKSGKDFSDSVRSIFRLLCELADLHFPTVDVMSPFMPDSFNSIYAKDIFAKHVRNGKFRRLCSYTSASIRNYNRFVNLYHSPYGMCGYGADGCPSTPAEHDKFSLSRSAFNLISKHGLSRYGWKDINTILNGVSVKTAMLYEEHTNCVYILYSDIDISNLPEDSKNSTIFNPNLRLGVTKSAKPKLRDYIKDEGSIPLISDARMIMKMYAAAATSSALDFPSRTIPDKASVRESASLVPASVPSNSELLAQNIMIDIERQIDYGIDAFKVDDEDSEGDTFEGVAVDADAVGDIGVLNRPDPTDTYEEVEAKDSEEELFEEMLGDYGRDELKKKKKKSNLISTGRDRVSEFVSEELPAPSNLSKKERRELDVESSKFAKGKVSLMKSIKDTVRSRTRLKKKKNIPVADDDDFVVTVNPMGSELRISKSTKNNERVSNRARRHTELTPSAKPENIFAESGKIYSGRIKFESEIFGSLSDAYSDLSDGYSEHTVIDEGSVIDLAEHLAREPAPAFKESVSKAVSDPKTLTKDEKRVLRKCAHEYVNKYNFRLNSKTRDFMKNPEHLKNLFVSLMSNTKSRYQPIGKGISFESFTVAYRLNLSSLKQHVLTAALIDQSSSDVDTLSDLDRVGPTVLFGDFAGFKNLKEAPFYDPRLWGAVLKYVEGL